MDLDAARTFLVANSRVLDRRRFEHLFDGGPAEAVRDAVCAYRNEDGGFGHALEPDTRCPGSQPLATWTALLILDQCDRWERELVDGALGWLEANEPEGGGAAFSLPSADGWPHAPWMAPQDPAPSSVIATGLNVSVLLRRGVEHPWVDRATALMWDRIDAFDAGHAYDVLAILRFLEAVPDRDRAQAAYEARIAPHLATGDLVTRDLDAEGEIHVPLEFAPEPGSIARAAFTDEEIAAGLDRLATEQLDDGGWMFNWLAWSPAAERDWRGAITVERLVTLKANDRVPA